MDSSPHDELFRATFSIPYEAEAFLRHWLAPDIRRQLDFSSLLREPDSFVDDQLKGHFSDMVYSCAWKGHHNRMRVAFLLEHKSQPASDIHLQLLRYLSNIYKHQKDRRKTLEPVIPIVIYHGKKRWKPKPFAAHFQLPDDTLHKYIPNFDFDLVDLHRAADDIIIKFRGHLLHRIFLLFKYHRQPDRIPPEMSKKVLIFTETELNRDQKVNFLRLLVSYFFRAFPGRAMQLILPFKNDPSMTYVLKGSIGERLIREAREAALKEGLEKGLEQGIEQGLEQGIEQGIKQGLEQGARKEKLISRFRQDMDLVLRLCRLGFDAGAMADISGLPTSFLAEFAARLPQADPDNLAAAAARADKCPDAESARVELAAGLSAFGLHPSAVDLYVRTIHPNRFP